MADRWRGVGFEAYGDDEPVFVISVAAQLTGMHPQTLRGYDRIGLVSPGRTGGGGRRYSLREVERLRTVAELTSAGIGIEGVRRILELEADVTALRGQVEALQTELELAQRALADAMSGRLPAVRATTTVTRYTDRRAE